jgi:hypothetical protein
MPALSLKADITENRRHVRKVPTRDQRHCSNKSYLPAVNGRSLAQDEPHTVVRCPKSALLLRRGRPSTEHGGGDENTVFGNRRMSGLFAFKRRASAREKKFNDQFCVPYCKNYCANPRKDGQPHSQNCFSKCLPMCHELGH